MFRAALRRQARRDAPALVQGANTLRAIVPSDYEAWAETASSCEAYLRRMQPRWPEGHLTASAYRARQRLFDEDRLTGRGHAWHIWADKPDRLVGAIRLSGIERGGARTGRLGYWIAEREAGRGYATSAVEAACAYAFGTLRLARVEAAHMPENVASARVLAKAGFSREGLARSYVQIDGTRRDHVLLARLATDPAPLASNAEAR